MFDDGRVFTRAAAEGRKPAGDSVRPARSPAPPSHFLTAPEEG